MTEEREPPSGDDEYRLTEKLDSLDWGLLFVRVGAALLLDVGWVVRHWPHHVGQLARVSFGLKS